MRCITVTALVLVLVMSQITVASANDNTGNINGIIDIIGNIAEHLKNGLIAVRERIVGAAQYLSTLPQLQLKPFQIVGGMHESMSGSDNAGRQENVNHHEVLRVNIPQTIKTGCMTTISWEICNPSSDAVEFLEVTAKVSKSGFAGFLINKEFKETMPVTVNPRDCYSDEMSIKVPENMYGIPLKGKWDINLRVRLQPQGISENKVIEVTII